jgi:polysaccharide export outer membrane protein
MSSTRCAHPLRRSLAILFWRVILPAGLIGVGSSCVRPLARPTQAPIPPQVVRSATRFRKEYVLAPGDQIEVAVRRAPEVSRTITIRPDGNISLPLVQDVAAAGLTPKELADRLTQRFSQRLVNPEVSVIPTQVRQPVVYVIGDVTAPSAVPLRDAPTAIQAITVAGGLKRTGVTKEISVIRLSDEGYVQSIQVPVEVRGQPGAYMALRSTLMQPDDVIFVPESGRSQATRIIEDFINRPLVGINSIAGVYLNFRFVQALTK